jgi:RNA polymerase sigma-70 factor (ECF subfamily)
MRRRKESRGEAVPELVTPALIERCRNGDQGAWAELVEATQRQVYTLCLRVLRDPDDAADATQETFVKVWRGLKGFRGEALFTTWLYRVAVNTAISKQRSRQRLRGHETRAEDEAMARLPSSDSTETTASARLELRDVEDALRRLPEHYRTAVVLRDVYGLSTAEIAGELRISETAAKVRVHRARKKLKEMAFDGE